jgi:hypothetical protein
MKRHHMDQSTFKGKIPYLICLISPIPPKLLNQKIRCQWRMWARYVIVVHADANSLTGILLKFDPCVFLRFLVSYCMSLNTKQGVAEEFCSCQRCYLNTFINSHYVLAVFIVLSNKVYSVSYLSRRI